MIPLRQTLSLFSAAFLIVGVQAQSIVATYEGDAHFDSLGISAGGAGDVDGDGIPDLIVGARTTPGSARVYSGADGTVLHRFAGDANDYDLFGDAVGGAGDVNGDGRADLIVGARWGDAAGQKDSGRVLVFSGADWSVLYEFGGDAAGDELGYSVHGAGDVNGDGLSDVVAGAPFASPHGLIAGSARVYSGADGSVLYDLHGDTFAEQFGASVSGAGDVNGDGFADVLVGAPLNDGAGTDAGCARVFSGADGSVLYTFSGGAGGDRFGRSVRGAGDVNRDGYADVIIGAYQDNTGNGADSGSARVFSGADGSVLHSFVGGSAQDQFGAAVGGAGDVDGDGFADLIVGAFSAGATAMGPGAITVFSGREGCVLYSLRGDAASDHFGTAVDGVGDLNGDGFADLIVSAPHADGAASATGRVTVISGCDLCHRDLGTRYCFPAQPNSTGRPARINARGRIETADNDVTLTASRMPIGQLGYFLCSATQGFVPFAGGSQGNLCLAGSVGRYDRAGEVLSSGTGGTFYLGIDLADTPQPAGRVTVQPGETWNFQAWFHDDHPGPTSNFTDAVSVEFN